MTISTDRLIVRHFTDSDIPALLDILSDIEVNRFLPWFPLKSIDEAFSFYEKRYKGRRYGFAICLKDNDHPIGYISIDDGEAHDLGYGIKKEFWHKGIAAEAGRAVLEVARDDGLPFVSATHDIDNPRSGNVMKVLGMKYMYSYEELWQPKGYDVTFRMYQISFIPCDVYMGYWNAHPHHFIENL